VSTARFRCSFRRKRRLLPQSGRSQTQLASSRSYLASWSVRDQTGALRTRPNSGKRIGLACLSS
jgi:hypothetical protein